MAYIRCDCAAIDALTTAAAHQPRCPDMTAQPAASAAMKNIRPSQGFQHGTTVRAGIHHVTPSTTAPPASAANTPPTAHAASTVSEAATMHHNVAPQSTPCAASRCTGRVSSQYSSGPRSKTPDPRRVACPTSGPWLVSTSNDLSAITLLSEVATHPSASDFASP